VKLNISIKKGY